MNGKTFPLFTLIIFSAMLFVPPLAVAEDQGKESELEATESTAIETQPYLGLGVAPLHPALTAQLPEITGKGRGVLVEHVMKESPAAKAGLKVHDILIRYDKQELYSPEQLVKLVRNDKPGREVSLSYVRAGKTQDSTVRLGEVPAREPVRQRAFRMPLDSPADSPMLTKQRDQMEKSEWKRQNDPRPWATFKSLTITKMDDGQYKAQIDFRDKDEKILHREYIGTREEIRKAIEKDESLPEEERKHLLRSLDQQAPAGFRIGLPPALREFFESDREKFNWPNLDF